MAGLACATANEQGIVGVAPGCSLASDSGRQFEGMKTLLSSAVEGIQRVIGSGARVVNLSLGYNHGNGNNKCLTQNLADQMITAFGSKQNSETASAFRMIAAQNPGVVFTVAAGNDCSPAPGAPALRQPTIFPT